MKRFRTSLTILSVLLAGACSDSGSEPAAPLVDPALGATVEEFAGEWHLTRWSVDSSFAGEVYLRLNTDLTFTLYQNIVSQGFEAYDGTFAFDPATACIRGTYSDGTPWGFTYILGSLTDRTMQWQALGTGDVSTYTRTKIPELTIDPTSRAEHTPTERPFL